MEAEEEEKEGERRLESNSGPHLFKMKQSRTKYWEHIMLIMPMGEKKEWESKDAIAACDDLGNKVELEIANYLNSMAHISHHQDPLLWWRENKHIYPNIARTAHKWLCIPAAHHLRSCRTIL